MLPSTKDADGPANLVIPSDDGVDFAFFSECSQIDGILLKSVKALFSGLALNSTIATGLLDACFEGCLG